MEPCHFRWPWVTLKGVRRGRCARTPVPSDQQHGNPCGEGYRRARHTSYANKRGHIAPNLGLSTYAQHVRHTATKFCIVIKMRGNFLQGRPRAPALVKTFCKPVCSLYFRLFAVNEFSWCNVNFGLLYFTSGKSECNKAVSQSGLSWRRSGCCNASYCVHGTFRGYLQLCLR